MGRPPFSWGTCPAGLCSGGHAPRCWTSPGGHAQSWPRPLDIRALCPVPGLCAGHAPASEAGASTGHVHFSCRSVDIVALCPGLSSSAGHAPGHRTVAHGRVWQAGPGPLRQDGLMDPVSAARAFVAERHPNADAAILGGSTAQGRSTPTSDLDIVVLYRDGAENYAETTRYEGWIVEAFVHTPASLASWYTRERDARCPVLGDLCAQGTLLTDRGPGEAWQREAQLYMDRGPEPLTDQDRGLRRYELSSSLDDLQGSILRLNPSQSLQTSFGSRLSFCSCSTESGWARAMGRPAAGPASGG